MTHYKKIAVLDNEIQALLLDSSLTERGIPHRMHNYYDRAYDGLFQFRKGWGHVEAPEEYEKEILEIVAELSRHPLDADDDPFQRDPTKR